MSVRTPRLAACLLAAAAATSAARAADIAGTLDIGGDRKIYVECRGTGAPPVMIVAGGKASAADWTDAAPGAANVFDAVAGFTRVCAYDRPGTPVGDAPSRSDPVPQPTTAAGSAEDLRALVAAADVARPFVLVAHSWGGLIARLYAMTHPEDVAGLVLVDALSEQLRAAETPQEWVWQRRILDGDMSESLKIYPDLEHGDADASMDQLLAAPPLRPMPLVVLSADRPWGPLVPGFIADGLLAPDTPPDVGYVTDRAQKVAQAELAALVPSSRHVTHTDSGHDIHKDQPELVIGAIRDVVDAVRVGRTALAP